MHSQQMKIEEAIAHLNEQAIVVSLQKGHKVYYQIRNEKVLIQNESARYVLSIEDFRQMFQTEVFYLVDKKIEQIEIQKEKDDEYYGWYHK